ncbi:hypothetical protein E8E14_001125 [Neopestalotiopsis sp. 37M]|nr:hypothetical protein E8E14_001125 [Neopestalotiopsis sp. 37M]
MNLMHDQAFKALQAGLRETVKQQPWLGGRVYPQSREDPSWRPGQLEIRYEEAADEQSDLPQFHYKQLDDNLAYEEDLEDNGFPIDVVPDEELIWMPLFVPIDSASNPEVLAAQANFVEGGCLLVVAINHTVCDGTAHLEVCKLWAANCDALQQGLPADVWPSENADRSLIDTIWKRETTDSREDVSSLPPEVWRLMNLDPPHLKANDDHGDNNEHLDRTVQLGDTGELVSTIFYISAAMFSELRQRCIAEATAGSTTPAPLSGNDAMCALIWRSLMKARREAALQASRVVPEDIEGAKSHIHMPLDARHNFSHSVPTPYLGNFTLMNRCEQELSSLTNDQYILGRIAQEIHAVSAAATHEAVLGAYAIARGVKDLAILPHGSGSGLQSFDNVITSLITYPMEDVRFGGSFLSNGGKPDALRPLMEGWNKSGRFCFVLPRKANGGVEFVLNTTPEEMRIMLQDDEFNRYATCF